MLEVWNKVSTSCQLKAVKGVKCAISMCDFENLIKLCNADSHILKAKMFHLTSSKQRLNNSGLSSLVVKRKKLPVEITGWLLSETGSSSNTVHLLSTNMSRPCNNVDVLFSKHCDLPLSFQKQGTCNLWKYAKCGKLPHQVILQQYAIIFTLLGIEHHSGH